MPGPFCLRVQPEANKVRMSIPEGHQRGLRPERSRTRDLSPWDFAPVAMGLRASVFPLGRFSPLWLLASIFFALGLGLGLGLGCALGTQPPRDAERAGPAAGGRGMKLPPPPPPPATGYTRSAGMLYFISRASRGRAPIEAPPFLLENTVL